MSGAAETAGTGWGAIRGAVGLSVEFITGGRRRGRTSAGAVVAICALRCGLSGVDRLALGIVGGRREHQPFAGTLNTAERVMGHPIRRGVEWQGLATGRPSCRWRDSLVSPRSPAAVGTRAGGAPRACTGRGSGARRVEARGGAVAAGGGRG